jgi:hypothetical protein
LPPIRLANPADRDESSRPNAARFRLRIPQPLSHRILGRPSVTPLAIAAAATPRPLPALALGPRANHCNPAIDP